METIAFLTFLTVSPLVFVLAVYLLAKIGYAIDFTITPLCVMKDDDDDGDDWKYTPSDPPLCERN